jgi:molecular chaperone GrpE (heat shock protein)
MAKKSYASYDVQINELEKQVSDLEAKLADCKPEDYLKLAKEYSNLNYRLQFARNMKDPMSTATKESVTRLQSVNNKFDFKYCKC